MSYRGSPGSDRELVTWIREVNERLEKLEQGGGHSGVVSFGDTIQIGNMELTVLSGGGTDHGLIVELRNLTTGSTTRLAEIS